MKPWYEEPYAGESTDELLALADTFNEYSVLEVVVKGLYSKNQRSDFEERFLDISSTLEEFNLEVKNGGFGQFLLNSSGRLKDDVAGMLREVGCLPLALITEGALSSLPKDWQNKSIPQLNGYLDSFNTNYYKSGIYLDDVVLDYAKRNREKIVLP